MCRRPTSIGNTNIPEANKLFTAAMAYKEKGWGTDYIDNQRRAEILFQKLLTEYPQSNRIDEAAYQLGDIYDSKAYKQYQRSAAYFERCFQWNPKTTSDARLRAARIYDKQLSDRSRAIEIYKEVTTHETDAKRSAEATKATYRIKRHPLQRSFRKNPTQPTSHNCARFFSQRRISAQVVGIPLAHKVPVQGNHFDVLGGYSNV